MKISNVPTSAYSHEFWVYRVIDGAAWYWGAWDSEMEALAAAFQVNGGVYHNK